MKISSLPNCDAHGEPIDGQVEFFKGGEIHTKQTRIFADAEMKKELSNPLRIKPEDGSIGPIYVEDDPAGLWVSDLVGNAIYSMDMITKQSIL